ncbi:hypothetical protein SAMN05443144_13210 [Fodinibius roseus]|uniref:Uncharacterized protein n=1 Tax=Fodinibius roseus TaxID=1194090 RepID=A0A1M5KGF6_9BACT|nr:hypothetical protein [Fodinibius roseus]SHG52034.1 hypothetical protein SAMN05443144_13210 [Fodinibius roseus]
MAKNRINITPENLTVWLRSTGYLFPRTKVELSRLNKLYPEVKRDTKDEQVDPYEMLENSREREPLNLQVSENIEEDYSGLRMAARKYEKLPEHIIEKMKKKHKNNGGDKSEN